MSNATGLVLTSSNQNIKGKKTFENINVENLNINLDNFKDKHGSSIYYYSKAENIATYNYSSSSTRNYWHRYFDPSFTVMLTPGIYKVTFRMSINRIDATFQVHLVYTQSTVQYGFVTNDLTGTSSQFNNLTKITQKNVTVPSSYNIDNDNLADLEGILNITNYGTYTIGTTWTVNGSTQGTTFTNNIYLILQKLK